MKPRKENEQGDGWARKAVRVSEKGAPSLPTVADDGQPTTTQSSRVRACVAGTFFAALLSSACILLLMYYLWDRMDILFVLRHGSIGFPEGGSIEANLTLTGQVVPGEFPARVLQENSIATAHRPVDAS